ncbi:MAG: hypothetical protein BWY18_00750 [Candidatus Cloacimonetes bacterium ADurb.Bin211]|nr:MAG: hypothetical protein BWY18_00750 [Candidatus Cloacimonetes bacterium ADurb.Bin211]
MFVFDDRFFFVTFSGDAKVHQIANNKWVEVCVPLYESDNTGYIRLTGVAHIVKNPALKAEAAEQCFFFDEYFQGYDDPDYTLIEFVPEMAEYLRPGERYSQTCNLKRYSG